MKQENIKKVLILRLSALGDTIHTLPLAAAIKKSYPDCKIGWVVEDKAKFFVEGNPIIDFCYVLPKKEWKKRGLFSLKNIREFKEIVNRINNEHYDVVLDTQQLLKSSSLLPFLNIKRKITLSGGREFSHLFSNEIYKSTHALFDFDYHVVKRNLEFARCMGVQNELTVDFVLKQSEKEVIECINRLLQNIDKTRKTVILAPATTWQNKHWKEEYWSEVLNFLAGKVNIIFTGTKAEEPLIQRIINKSDVQENEVLSLAGKTNLEELTELFRHSDVVLSPDSGSAHIAWAVSKPVVVTLFSATAENRCAPFGDNCYVLAPKLDCRPCMRRKCRLSKNKNICCELVKPYEVISLLKNVLQL